MTLRIPVVEPCIGSLERDALIKCVESGFVSSVGPQVPEFERAVASYLSAEHCVATANGTAALHLALAALGVGPGHEVILPSLTFVATANAVSLTGATPVLAEVDPITFCLDMDDVSKRITSKTKVVIPVHLYGHSCDMDALLSITGPRGIFVVEDAAEALGATYKGRRLGSIGDIGCFSFFGNKIITTGEGGMCVTNSSALAERIKSLRSHCQDPKRRYWHTDVGFNYRMTSLQAALGIAQLRQIETFLAAKRRNAQAYDGLLCDLPHVQLPTEPEWSGSAWWMYSVVLKNTGYPNRRDQVMQRMGELGVETRPFFGAIHKMAPYAEQHQFQTTERLSEFGMSLPSSVTLTDEQLSRVASVFRDVSLSYV